MRQLDPTDDPIQNEEPSDPVKIEQFYTEYKALLQTVNFRYYMCGKNTYQDAAEKFSKCQHLRDWLIQHGERRAGKDWDEKASKHQSTAM